MSYRKTLTDIFYASIPTEKSKIKVKYNSIKMKRIIVIVLIPFILIYCKPKINNTSTVNVAIVKSNSSEKKASSGMKIFDCKLIKEHAFSDQNKKDTFKLFYNCNNLEDSMMVQISSFSGAIIYKKGFMGTDFYDYSRPWYLYVSDPKRGSDFVPEKLNSQVADSLHKADLIYIKKRMNEFFGEVYFTTNPIKKLDKDMLIMSEYKDIQSDSTVIRFSYRLWEGGGFQMIAYSKKLQEVKIIAASD